MQDCPVDVAKVAQREARHEKRRGPAPRKPKTRLTDLSDLEQAVVSGAVVGKSNLVLAQETGEDVSLIRSLRTTHLISKLVHQLQRGRKLFIEKARDASEVQTLELLLAAGDAKAAALDKIKQAGSEVENLPLLHEIHKDAQDRAGLPVVKRTDSRTTHADLGNPIVAKLLTQNQKFRAIDGGRAEVVDSTEETEIPSIENDTQARTG